MGVKDLFPLLRGLNDFAGSLEELKGLTFGLDASNFMFKAMTRSSQFAKEFHQAPSIDISQHMCRYWNEIKASLDKFSITIILVYDGKRNLLKAEERESRDAKIKETTTKMRILMQNGNADDLEEINRLGKQCCYVREDVLYATVQWAKDNNVRCVCAPVEADWQLVSLEKNGITDGSISEDSDLVALGGKLVISKLNFTKSTCDSFKIKEVLGVIGNHVTPDIPWTIEILSAFCCFLGNDFIKRPPGQGPAELMELMNHYVRADTEDRGNMVDIIGTSGKFSDAYVDSTVVYSGKKIRKKKRKRSTVIIKADTVYGISWRRAVSLLSYAPVFSIDKDDGAVTCGYLNPLPIGQSIDQLIGFNPFKDLDTNMLLEYVTMNRWIRTNQALQCLKQPRNHNGALLPWGCYLDFQILPVNMQPRHTLEIYLACRGIRVNTSTTFKHIQDATKCILRQPNRDSRIQPVGDRGELGRNLIQVRGSANWIHDPIDILNLIRTKLVGITDDKIDEIFGERDGVELRIRAKMRFESGHLDLSTIRYCECYSNEEENENEKVYLLGIQCTASMKADVRDCFIAFCVTDGIFVPAPVSYCHCPCGRLFCSHMLAFLLFIGAIQHDKNNTMDWDEIVQCMPEPVKSMSALPIAVSFVQQNKRTRRKEKVQKSWKTHALTMHRNK
jgi:5'-3' exonuclease